MTEIDAAPATPGYAPPPATPAGSTASVGTEDGPDARSSRLAALLFAAFVAVAFPIVLFKLGSYMWFFRDDFSFVTDRRATSLDDLFRPHNVHWSTVPIVAFRGLWSVFGIRSYVPYQACVVLLHLTATVLLRLVMRRAGVGPWVATAAAGCFVLFGPGAQNILWAFQIGFVGSLLFGLVQLILADHDGPVDRRDWLGIGAGILALMSSGVGVTMAIVVGLATLLRRGWKVAALHTVPLAGLFGIWTVVEHPQDGTSLGRAPLDISLRWLRAGETTTFIGLGHFQLLAVALVAVLVVGLVMTCAPGRGRELRGRAAVPVALFAGGVVFSLITAQGRGTQGEAGARASRYLYLLAAFALPALAVAADAVARRWRVLLPAVIAMFLIAVPFNVSDFDTGVFGPGYFDSEERVLTSAVRMPFVDDVPRDVRPIQDPFLSPGLTIGFLLDAYRAGKLHPSTGPMSPRVVNELKVRLGVAQRPVRSFPSGCRRVSRPLDLAPPKGTVYGITDKVVISTRSGAKRTSAPVTFSPINGTELTIELPGLRLRLEPGKGSSSFMLCRAP